MGVMGGAAGGASAGAAAGPWGAAIGAGMGLLGGLFGPKKPSLRELPTNPFIDQLAYLPYEMGPARKYWKGILKDPLSNPGVRQFDTAEATATEEARRRPSLTLGPGGKRAIELGIERQKQNIGAERMGYVGNLQSEAAGGLADLWKNKNMFTANNLANAGKLRQGQYTYI